METRVEVKTIRVKYKCPKCETGFLSWFGNGILATYPTIYNHTCSNKDCGYSEGLLQQYPYVEYEEDKFKTLPYNVNRYISTGADGERVLLYGYPINPDEPKGVWQCFGEIYPIAEEQQDKVEFQKIYLQQEVEIREVGDKKIAFIKSLN